MTAPAFAAPGPGEPRAAVLGADAPWRTGDLLLAAGLAGLGLAGLAAAWYAGSDHADWADVLPSASLGVAATAVSILGLLTWLVAGLRRVRRLRADVLPLLQATAALAPSTRLAAVHSPAARTTDAYVSAPKMTRFHVPTCPMVSGKPVRPLRRDEAEAGGLTACGVCTA